MSFYRTCPNCGAHLDPGERCDCEDARFAKQEKRWKERDRLEAALIEEKNGQLRMAV